jgi:AcrR family transcriptional regulator
MDRRAQILKAASAIVAERGIDALSVRNVAAAAGLGASTLRHYFPSQKDLYDAFLGDAFHSQLSDVRIEDSRVEPAERLMECMAQFLPLDDMRKAELEGWFFLYSSGIGPERTEQGARLLATLTRHARDRVERWLGQLDSEGALLDGSISDHATLLLSLVDGLSLQIVTPDSGMTVHMARHILSITIARAVIDSGT